MSKKLEVHYWSDILCVWAYVSEVRVKELVSNFSSDIALTHAYFPVFGAAVGKLDALWADKGGRVAYNIHVRDIVARFGCLSVAPDIWLVNAPVSSFPAHLYVCAAQWLEQKGDLALGSSTQLAWGLRSAFFAEGVDVSRRTHIFEVAEQQGVATSLLESAVASGAAYALLAGQATQAADASIKTSPTLSFNEGRQRLSGNVGYRIIEANIRELLAPPNLRQSWC